MIAALLERAVLPAQTQQALQERAGGNPLYAEEFVRLLSDRGELAEGVEVPESVQALIAARLDTLSQDRKSLLQDAAVVGKVFWAGALAEMGEREPREVELALHELARKELVRPARDLVDGGRGRVRVLAPARPRRGLRPDSACRPCQPSPGDCCLAGAQGGRAGGGSGGRARLPLHAGARARPGSRRRRAGSAAGCAGPAVPGLGGRARARVGHRAGRSETRPGAGAHSRRRSGTTGAAGALGRGRLLRRPYPRGGRRARTSTDHPPQRRRHRGQARASILLARIAWRLGEGGRNLALAGEAVSLLEPSEPGRPWSPPIRSSPAACWSPATRRRRSPPPSRP